ncbi:peptidase M23 [Rhodohalobacter sp. SW132]|nr:peptidoglycan DD-metalloendopeptidase family protein [Rhodohalobacter sp. SW132]REL29111.1 peptidase M23 [Rhodohalobacter sp. SW132]
MIPPFDSIPEVDFSGGFNPALLKDGWGIGGYNERRENMYIAPQYKNERNIHMGVDIWAPIGEPVYAPADGIVAYTANHDEAGNYGGTIVLRHLFKGRELFALYGHLSLHSLNISQPGKNVMAGERIGWLGDESENGNWHPHLHYQLSFSDPEEADMPGVVSEKEREAALKRYPDPEKIFELLYC